MLSELIKTPVKVTNYICIFKHIQKDGKPNVGASVMKMLKPLKGIVMLCESSSLATKVDTKMVLVFFFFVLVWTVTLTYILWFDIVKNKNITYMLGRSAVLSSANKRFTWMYLSNWALRHELPHPISEAAPFPGTMLNEQLHLWLIWLISNLNSSLRDN